MHARKMCLKARQKDVLKSTLEKLYQAHSVKVLLA
jgi:hypothetical protein